MQPFKLSCHYKNLRKERPQRSFDENSIKLPSLTKNRISYETPNETSQSFCSEKIHLNDRSTILQPHETDNSVIYQLISEIFIQNHHKDILNENSLSNIKTPAAISKSVKPKKPLTSKRLKTSYFPEFSIEGMISPRHFRAVEKKEEKRPPKAPVVETLPKSIPKSTSNPPRRKIEIAEKEFVYLKEWVHLEWNLLIQKNTGLRPAEGKGEYKYYIGKGNNSALVNMIMKTRWWWSRVDTPAKANFVWTQFKHRATVEKILDETFPVSEIIEEKEVLKPKIPRSMISKKLDACGFDLISNSPHFEESSDFFGYEPYFLVLHNRLLNNGPICMKKRLLKNMKAYYTSKEIDAFTRIPLTYHVAEAESFEEFLEEWEDGSLWIIKPGEGTNRGTGITVTRDIDEIKSIINSKEIGRSYVIQKYITRPLLIHHRKFDIRCFSLVTCLGKKILTYFYKEGYIRTSSKKFSLKKTHDKFIHLTNDAIQKKSENYGKFELGNKMSYKEFQKYLEISYPGTDFFEEILPRIKEVVADTISAVSSEISPNGSSCTFEIFGYDFMIDEDFKVWLIEVNTNPCLELSCSYLAKLIPAMLDNAFRISLDPVFPVPIESKKFKMWAQEAPVKNNFELIFSSRYDKI